MYLFVVIIFCFFCSSAQIQAECYTDVGIAAHSNKFDNDTNKKETNSSIVMDNPIGVLNYECVDGRKIYFINHDSSITDTHDRGLTKAGIKYRF